MTSKTTATTDLSYHLRQLKKEKPFFGRKYIKLQNENIFSSKIKKHTEYRTDYIQLNETPYAINYDTCHIEIVDEERNTVNYPDFDVNTNFPFRLLQHLRLGDNDIDNYINTDTNSDTNSDTDTNSDHESSIEQDTESSIEHDTDIDINVYTNLFDEEYSGDNIDISDDNMDIST